MTQETLLLLANKVLNHPNLALLGVVLVIAAWEMLRGLLRKLAKRTDTSIDDKAVDAMDAATDKVAELADKAWVEVNATDFFLAVEQLSVDVPQLKGPAKLALAMGKLLEAWHTARGKGMTAAVADAAKAEFARLAAEAKKQASGVEPQ